MDPDVLQPKRFVSVLAGPKIELPNKTVIEQIVGQMNASPEQIALVHGTTRYSYRELALAASATAQQLRTRQIEPNHLVPILCGGGVPLVIAILGTMLAGAAFVPLDIKWPEQRLQAVLTNLSPHVVLFERSLDTSLLEPKGVACFPISLCGVSESEPVVRNGEDICYGVFTSGSTGTPKCCLNTQRGLLNRFSYMSRYFDLRPGETVLQNSHHVFDSSLWQLLWPLSIGATVVIPDRCGILDVHATLREIAEHKVVMTDFVPSILSILVRALEARSSLVELLSSLRFLLVGGEEINPSTIRKLKRLLPSLSVINTYGPTECAIGMAFHEICKTDESKIPLGSPIANTYAVILDERNRAVPVGTVGQIAISGDCLGAGYFDEPQQTEAAFILNPFHEIPYPRLYLTGDLGHVGADGLLHFNGRNDSQIKLGGVRIELGEVSSMALSVPGITDFVALPHTLPNGSATLIGFACSDSRVSPKALKTELERYLPKGSVPSRIYLLDQMPLTPNGKVDRGVLMALLGSCACGTAQSSSKDAVLETTLTRIWRAELGLPDADAQTNYFDEGGDSLSAVNIILGISEALGRAVTVDMLMRAPTPSMMAEMLIRSSADEPEIERLRALVNDDLERAWSIIGGPRPSKAIEQLRPRTVFMTGATGYVGVHALDALLDSPIERIICLIRASCQADGRDRLKSAFAQNRIHPDRINERISVVPGTLGKRYFGLPLKQFRDLARSSDLVLHAGAEVNLAKPYAELRPINVQGTIDVIEFSSAGDPIPIHFLSTLSVFRPTSFVTSEAQTPPLTDALELSGYECTKAAAETILLEARNAGIPVSVFRIGEAMPSVKTAAINPKSIIHQIIGASIRMNVYTRLPVAVDFSPVDVLAKAISKALTESPNAARNYHVFNRRALNLQDFFAAVNERRPLKEVDYASFHAKLKSVSEEFPCVRELRGLLAQLPLPAWGDEGVDRFLGRFREPGLLYHETATAALGIDWPEPHELVRHIVTPASP
ncbi:non-ribosomal peptide synthetase [Bradyrhizobium sp. STM 3562]|uniref:non-ribosomal peptide synthetase n=1 Tax=Bradyrhizobium sp. STM 3562 TaxID=578924 RepID=UPI00388F8F7C